MTGGRRRLRRRRRSCSTAMMVKPLRYFDGIASGRSTGAPGAVAMLGMAHGDYGTLAWARHAGSGDRTGRRRLRRQPAHGIGLVARMGAFRSAARRQCAGIFLRRWQSRSSPFPKASCATIPPMPTRCAPLPGQSTRPCWKARSRRPSSTRRAKTPLPGGLTPGRSGGLSAAEEAGASAPPTATTASVPPRRHRRAVSAYRPFWVCWKPFDMASVGPTRRRLALFHRSEPTRLCRP